MILVMDDIRLIDPNMISYWLTQTSQPFHSAYYAMYSSILDGIVTTPMMMMVPVDDHLVHRGDGVFETIKCVNGTIYCLTSHLERLFMSARKIGLFPPWSQEAIQNIILQTVRAGGQKNCLIRILLSRGPGSFGISPYDCPKPALYVIAHAASSPFMQIHPKGARVITSQIPIKPSYFANIKSCNYLQNVLMKKEATDAGVDFTLSFDERGFLAEGATENAGIVSAENSLCIPKLDRILCGTTMTRVFELAQCLVDQKMLQGKIMRDISKEMIASSREMFIFGTTPDVTAVIDFDGKLVGDGRPGPIFAELSKLLQEDIRHNRSLQTSAFPPAV